MVKRTGNCCPALQTDVCVVIDFLIGIHLVWVPRKCAAKRNNVVVILQRKCCKIIKADKLTVTSNSVAKFDPTKYTVRN